MSDSPKKIDVVTESIVPIPDFLYQRLYCNRIVRKVNVIGGHASPAVAQKKLGEVCEQIRQEVLRYQWN